MATPPKKGASARKWLPIVLKFLDQVRIRSKDRAPTSAEEAERGVPLELYGSQRMFLNEVLDGLDQGIREFLNLKSRQLGITTISLLIDVVWLTVHPGILGCLVADTETNRDSFRETLKLYFKSLPAHFMGDVRVVRENRHFLLLSNGARLNYLVAGITDRNQNWGESQGYTFCHCTEVAKYGSAEGFQNFRESLSTEHPDRLFLYESTAKGLNHWKAMWEGFGEDTFTKKRFFIGWWAKETNIVTKDDPRFVRFGTYGPTKEEREKIEQVATRYGVLITQEMLAWRRWKETDIVGSIDSMDQNQPWLPEEAFVLDGFSFFQTKLLQEDIKRVSGDPPYEDLIALFQGYRFILGNDCYACVMEPLTTYEEVQELCTLRIWEEPKDGAEYVIGCDPAHGANENSDRHVISVWRCFADRMIQVAEYADNSMVETRQCAWILAYIAGAYSQGTNRVMVNIELYGPGRVIMNELDNLRIRIQSDLYAQKTRDKGWEDFLTNMSWFMYFRYDTGVAGNVKNFETTGRTKREIMLLMRDTYSTALLEVRSLALLMEMSYVVQTGADISAPAGDEDYNKDDRVIGAALAIRTWNDWVRPRMVAAGASYQAVMDAETGNYGNLGALTNRVVMNFLKTEAERLDTVDNVPKWMRERGFA